MLRHLPVKREKMDLVLKLYSQFRNLILYGIIGSFTSFLDFCIFTILSEYISLYYLVANCISVLIGISTSFILNRKFNFKVEDHYKRRFIIFLGVGLCGLALSNFILYLGVEKMHIDNLFMKFASIILVVGFQFILNKFVTFKYNFDK